MKPEDRIDWLALVQENARKKQEKAWWIRWWWLIAVLLLGTIALSVFG